MHTYIIADMACSHEGRLEFARKIIGGAGAAGADAIQFQIWSADEMMVPHHPDFPVLQRIELSRDNWSALAEYTRERFPEMQIIACVYDPGTIEFCEKLGVDAYKIHTADLSNPYLIRETAKTRRRIDLSVGASTVEEIQAAVALIQKTSAAKVWLMYGIQTFPTPIRSIHLNYMLKLKQLFELPTGYQDHTDASRDSAFWICAAASGAGIDIIEKHITHDRAFGGVDHEAALNPDEFGRFVNMIREIDKAKGISVPKLFSDEERRYRKYSKKSIVAAGEIPEGKTITDDDMMFRRAETTGMPPDRADLLLGKKALRPISAFELISDSDVG